MAPNRGRVHALLVTFELDHGRDPRPSSARAEAALRRALALNPTLQRLQTRGPE